jgi:hypothetical protein
MTSEFDLEKMKFLGIGSAIGAAVSMACAPAVSHRDAVARLAVCLGTAFVLAPLLTRLVIKWFGLPEEATAEVAILVAWFVSLVSWWVIFAFLKIVQTRSEGFVQEGLAFLLPKRLGDSLQPPKKRRERPSEPKEKDSHDDQ